MDAQFLRALETDTLIDITTQGRHSGNSHQIEITFHYLEGETYISGLPGKRDWYANMVANPAFTLHLKQSVAADLNAVAVPITDPSERRRILTQIVARWDRPQELEAFVADSPLVRVSFPPTP